MWHLKLRLTRIEVRLTQGDDGAFVVMNEYVYSCLTAEVCLDQAGSVVVCEKLSTE